MVPSHRSFLFSAQMRRRIVSIRRPGLNPCGAFIERCIVKAARESCPAPAGSNGSSRACRRNAALPACGGMSGASRPRCGQDARRNARVPRGATRRWRYDRMPRHRRGGTVWGRVGNAKARRHRETRAARLCDSAFDAVSFSKQWRLTEAPLAHLFSPVTSSNYRLLDSPSRGSCGEVRLTFLLGTEISTDSSIGSESATTT